MTSLDETAMDHQLAADDEDTLDRAPVTAGAPLTEDLQPAVSQDDQDRPVLLMASGTELEPLPEPPAAIADESMSTRWREIQSMFVDDPRASAEMAARLADESVQELIASVTERQDSLLARWHGQDAGTEELRTVVQHYRAFGTRLADFGRDG